MQPCGFCRLDSFCEVVSRDRDGAGLGWVGLEVEWGVWSWSWSWSCQSGWIAVQSVRTAEEDACRVVLVGVVESCIRVSCHIYDHSSFFLEPHTMHSSLPRNDHCVGCQILSFRCTVCDVCVPSREELLLCVTVCGIVIGWK